MNLELKREVLPRLLNDYDFKEGATGFLQQGRCPSCGKKELYANSEAPWVLRCGRLNKCGSEIHIKDIYSDLFNSWSERFQPTPQDPIATAKAYMRDARGFRLELISGWFKQGSYWCPKRDIGTATVLFDLPNGATWERFIDKPQRFGKMKANFKGSYQGYWWEPPTFDINTDEIWLVEGIFDAIALTHIGIQAVSLMSCNNYPDIALEQLQKRLANAGVKKRPKLIFALDDGKAGEKFTRKFVTKYRKEGWECGAAQPPKGRFKLDWNELLQRDRLKPDDLKEYKYLGDLLIAKSANEKAKLMYRKTGKKEFPFSKDSRLYWFKMDLDRYNKALDQLINSPDNDGRNEEELKDEALKESGTVVEIAACYPQALYYQANELTDESWYYFKVSFPHDGEDVKNTFTGGQLSSASEFKKRLMGVAPGAVWTGTAGQLDRLMKEQLYDIKRVQTVDFIGYSKTHRAYVLGDVAVKDGQVSTLNEEDYFDLGKLSVKSLNKSVDLHLETDFKKLNTSWANTLWNAFDAKGFAALAFWFGSLFAEQIREEHKSFPFLEIVGEPGTGKSTLIEFMWKLCGRRDYEGFDPSKSTLAARARNFSQVSNMPVVLIEGDRGDGKDAKQKGFDWDELKTAFNGRSVRARGLKNSGNETYEPPFRGAIVIAQNAEVQASEAILSRIVHIMTDRKGQTAATREAAQALESMPMEEVSGFMLKCAVNEKAVLERFNEKYKHYRKQLEAHPELKTQRIMGTHAQVMALVDCLAIVADVTEDQMKKTREEIECMAVQRQKAVSADHPVVQEFWDVVDYLEDMFDEPQVNHSANDNEIAINLNHLSEIAFEHRQQLPPMTELKKLLKASRKRKFIGQKTVNSSINRRFNSIPNAGRKKPTSVKCWVFHKES